MTDSAQQVREAARKAIFDDLRDRKLLKYLFEEEPDNVGAYGYVTAPIDVECQRECVDRWIDLVLAALASTTPPDRADLIARIDAETEGLVTPNDRGQLLLDCRAALASVAQSGVVGEDLFRPFKQVILHHPPETYGDCQRTCLGMVLGIDPTTIPHFADPRLFDADGARRAEREWLAARGYGYVQLPLAGEHGWEWAEAVMAQQRGTPFVVSGRSPRGAWNHDVVYLDGKIYDPHPDDTGLAGPCMDSDQPDGPEWYWIGAITRLAAHPSSVQGAAQESDLRAALERCLAKRSVPTMDPHWSAAFNAALDMVRRDVLSALPAAEEAQTGWQASVTFGPCQHQWGYMPTTGCMSCARCNEFRSWDDPLTVRIREDYERATAPIPSIAKDS